MSQWVGTHDAAERLGVSLRSLYRLIDHGVLPAYKIGRAIRLRSADLTSFLANRPGPTGLEHLYPGSDDPGPGLSGIREPRRPRPYQPPGSEHLGLTGGDGGRIGGLGLWTD